MKRPGFVLDSLGLAAATYVARAVMLARGLAAAAVMGPGGFGTWNALNLVLDYGSYASAGALQGLDLRLPAAERAGDAALVRRLLAGTLSVIAAAFTVFGVGLGIALATGLPALTVGVGPGPALVMLAAAGVQLGIQLSSSALKARGTFTPVSEATALQAVLGGGLGIALVAPFGLWGLALGWLAGGVVALARLWVAAPHVPRAPARPREGLALAGAGLPVFGFFLASLVLRSADRVALAHFGRPEALGLYSLGLMAAALVLYLPESVAAVLYPRIAAAAADPGALDRVRAETVRVHRALAVLVPLAVGVGLVWVAPVLLAWLPRFRGAVEPVRLLVFGALLLSAATIPGYWLLARGRAWALLGVGVACAALTAVLVTGVAARAPRPSSVAVAALFGYGLFAVTMVLMASRDLLRDADARLGFVAVSFVPAVWVGAAALAVCGVGPVAPFGAAFVRTLAVAVLYAPVAWWFARGLGLRGLLRGATAREVRP